MVPGTPVSSPFEHYLRGARDSQTHGVVEALLHPNHEDATLRHLPRIPDGDRYFATRRKLLQAMWLHARAKLGEGGALRTSEDAEPLETSIWRALELLDHFILRGPNLEKDEKEEELLRWTIWAMETSNGQRKTSN